MHYFGHAPEGPAQVYLRISQHKWLAPLWGFVRVCVCVCVCVRARVLSSSMGLGGHAFLHVLFHLAEGRRDAGQLQRSSLAYTAGRSICFCSLMDPRWDRLGSLT